MIESRSYVHRTRDNCYRIIPGHTWWVYSSDLWRRLMGKTTRTWLTLDMN